MALIKCPECGREISNMAVQCIYCGYPLNVPGGVKNSLYRVVYTGMADYKYWEKTVKYVRELGYGLEDAHNMIKFPPTVIKSMASKSTCEAIKRNMESLGAMVSIEEDTGAAENAVSTEKGDGAPEDTSLYKISLTKFPFENRKHILWRMQDFTHARPDEVEAMIAYLPVVIRNAISAKDCERIKEYMEAEGATVSIERDDESTVKDTSIENVGLLRPESPRPKPESKIQATPVASDAPQVVCPYCGAHNATRIGVLSRTISIYLLWGLSSGKVGKQWHCNTCKSDF